MSNQMPDSKGSPCTNVCILDEYGYCAGCHRTMDEITAWPQMNEQERRQVLERIEHRRAARASRATESMDGPCRC